MTLPRRHFLNLLGASLATSGFYLARSSGAFAQDSSQPYSLVPLPYAYDALEPYIDQETMRFHHDQHHATYVKNLNLAVSKYPELQNKSVEDLVKNLPSLPLEIRTTVRNNAGGDINHTMFWQIMSPKGGGKPSGKIAQAINDKYGSFAEFQTAFSEAADKVFGSGWAWLVLNKSGKLDVITTANQDSPLMQGLYPIMGTDVWEHAYYLKYRNKRAEYLTQWWNVVNWDEVNKRYLAAIAA